MITDQSKFKSKKLGQYYTPTYIVDYIIDQTIGYSLKFGSDKISSLKILDPACGMGIFLTRALEFLLYHFETGKNSNESLERIKRTIIANQLYGIDIDHSQIAETQKNLECLDFNANFKVFNALLPPPSFTIPFNSSPLEELRVQYKRNFINGTLSYSKEEEQQEISQIEKGIEEKIKTKLEKENKFSSDIQPMLWEMIFPETKGKFDIIIGNPPWGGTLFSSDLISSYNVGTQQVDSWSLFIERSLQALKEGGRLGFVIPNTLLLNENYIEVRKIILETCKIIKIVNLGEKVFSETTQPCMIIIIEKGATPPKHKLEIIPHIPNIIKKNLNKKRITLLALLTIKCIQERFLNNLDYQFDIFSIGFEELKEIVEKDLHHDKIQVQPLGNLVENARGVEINKNGKIFQCSSCGWWSSPPSHFNTEGIKTKRCINPKCHGEVTQHDKIDYIVFDNPYEPERDKPFLVGHHIQRYCIKNHKYINSSRVGINYKNPALYQGPKLLLRKTGHGIKTAIDYNNRWVNQVVYFFKLKEEVPVTLEYLMGVLNSKLMHKYFFSEFADPYRRDFPHFTQKKFLRLPIKVPRTKNEVYLVNQVAKYAKILQSRYQRKYSLTNKHTQEKALIVENLDDEILQLENEIDNLVFKLYEFPPNLMR